jgi:hypothetical protein
MKVFRDFGQIVVDDMRDVLHVNTARSQVGRDQDAIASLLKPGKCGGSLRLRAVAVNHSRRKSFAIQILG